MTYTAMNMQINHTNIVISIEDNQRCFHKHAEFGCKHGTNQTGRMSHGKSVYKVI